MLKPVITTFNQLAPILIQEYERYLPTAFDESMTLLQKVNKIIQHLTEMGISVNNIGVQWNEVMEWVMNDGLSDSVNNKLDEMVLDGTLQELINTEIFADLETRISDSLGVMVESHPRLEGETDDTQRIQRTIDFVELNGGGTVRFADHKSYTVSSNIILKKGVHLDLGKSTIQAIEVIVGAIIETELNVQHFRPMIKGGHIDCNMLADTGIHLKYFAEAFLSDTEVLNCKKFYFRIGDVNSVSNSYACKAVNLHGDRPRVNGLENEAPTSSVGLQLERCSDSYVEYSTMIGVETGFKTITGGSGNKFHDCHAWCRLGVVLPISHPNVMKVGFDIGGTDTFISGCVADTVQQYGFRIRNWRVVMHGNKIWNNNQGNNTVIGIRVDNPTAKFVTIHGTIFSANDVNVRIAKDIEFGQANTATSDFITIEGSVWSLVGTTTTLRAVGLGSADNTTNLDYNYQRNNVTVLQTRVDTNNNFLIIERDPANGSYMRDLMKIDPSNNLISFGLPTNIDTTIPRVDAFPPSGANIGRFVLLKKVGGDDELWVAIQSSAGTGTWRKIALALS